MTAVTISAANISGSASHQITLDRIPDECPLCHFHVQPLQRYAAFNPVYPTSILHAAVVFQCTRAECLALFIASYLVRRTNAFGAFPQGAVFALQGTAPRTPTKHDFPAEIKDLSPQFVAVFNEAAAAEDFDLSEVAGPGYGKALEFLIKDFLIRQQPEDAAVIKREFLGAAIQKRVGDPRIKAVSERAAWLRNDESHYERRWEGKDMQDLKNLIRLVVSWIHTSIMTENLLRDMPDP